MTATSNKTIDHVDVLIIGAGLSGIGAGCHLAMKSPDTSYAIIESRDVIGGTWDLFRYPGVRSDSDMYTFGFNFRPWENSNPLAEGQAICDYLEETAIIYDVDSKIRFKQRITKARWSSENRLWTFDITRQDTGETLEMTSNFLYACTGYYNYEHGYLPEFKGYDDFKGIIAHPQLWPQDLDYKGKSVLVIGSGATAVTLVPAMAGIASHVTMLQRSPTYIFSRPAIDKIAAFLNRVLPIKLAYSLNRLRNVTLMMYLYRLCKKKPEMMKEYIINGAREVIDDDAYIEKHLTPTYNPWDQRVCLVPDADLFVALRDGDASIVTDHIAHFTETGIKLKSGDEITTDIIVPATGLDLQFLGGMELWVDDKKIESGDLMNYKGMMLSNVPNMVTTFGYTNASWTLKADLTADYVARLMNYMKKHSYNQVVPYLEEGSVEVDTELFLDSGYFKRARDILPKPGMSQPWRNKMNYAADRMTIKYGKINDGILQFSKASDNKADRAA